MSEPPRPPGDGVYGTPPDPSSSQPPSGPSFSVPGEAPGPGYPPTSPDQYAPPPVSGGGYGPPPTSGGGYAQPPTSGGGYGQPQAPGGYGQPQPPGYPPAAPPGAPYGSGYQQPGQPPYGYPAAGAPAGYANNDEKTWALIAHFGGILFGFIAPLVALLAKGNESPTVKAHAVEALNFQITWGIAMLVAVIITVCSFGLLFFVVFIPWLVIIIFSIMGGLKANTGELYRYPATYRFIK